MEIGDSGVVCGQSRDWLALLQLGQSGGISDRVDTAGGLRGRRARQLFRRVVQPDRRKFVRFESATGTDFTDAAPNECAAREWNLFFISHCEQCGVVVLQRAAAHVCPKGISGTESSGQLHVVEEYR